MTKNLEIFLDGLRKGITERVKSTRQRKTKITQSDNKMLKGYKYNRLKELLYRDNKKDDRTESKKGVT